MAQRRRQRRRWSDDEKRTLVAVIREPGDPVSPVARRYDVNANQVSNRMRDPRNAPVESGGAQADPVFLPVETVAEQSETAATPTGGSIAIELTNG